MICQQNDCTNEATHDVYWPGKHTKQCLEHAKKAQALGNFMGFQVLIRTLENTRE